MASQREYSLDALKMVLIALVIYAHIPLLGGLMPAGDIEIDAMTWHSVKGIYSFHMPLFVLLSGYFTRRKDVRSQWKGSVKLLKLFVFFQVVDLALKGLSVGQFPTLHDCICPSFALWYLLCLFYWRMLISLLPATLDRRLLVIGSIVISLLIGFVPIRGELGFQRFFSFMPYFFIGHYYGEWLMQKIDSLILRLTPPLLLVCIIATGLMVVVSSYNPRWLNVIISPYPDILGLPLRMVFLLGSTLVSILLILEFRYKKNWDGSKLAVAGRDTLFFYLYHPYVLCCVVVIWKNYSERINMAEAIGITMLTIAILLLLKQVKPLYSILR